MNRTLSVAASGMATQAAVLDSIAANLANVDVPGYRVSRTDFSAFISPDGRVVAAETGSAHRPGLHTRHFTPGRSLTRRPLRLRRPEGRRHPSVPPFPHSR